MEPLTIIGAGGIGCAVGYALRVAGVPVTFVDADAGKVAWGRSHGVRVDRRPPLSATFETFADWSPASGGTFLLCTKCYDNDAVLSRLSDGAQLIPIQNGFDPALEARGKALEGIASFISECAPHATHTRITRFGKLHFGTRVNQPSLARRANDIADCLRACEFFRVETVPDILPFKYTKLLYNAAISPIAAAAGIDNGRLLSLPKARRLFFALIRENYAILHNAGMPLARIGPCHPEKVARILRHGWVARAFAWAFYPTLRRTYCSMAGDLPAGRTEIDFYNRHLIDLAGAFPCPLNRQVYALVKRMERERMAPHLGVLDALV
jgi:2-dehydropantoate 2-reductase